MFGPRFAKSDLEQSCPRGISTVPNFSSNCPFARESLIRLETNAKSLFAIIVFTYTPTIFPSLSNLYFRNSLFSVIAAT